MYATTKYFQVFIVRTLFLHSGYNNDIWRIEIISEYGSGAYNITTRPIEGVGVWGGGDGAVELVVGLFVFCWSYGGL